MDTLNPRGHTPPVQLPGPGEALLIMMLRPALHPCSPFSPLTFSRAHQAHARAHAPPHTHAHTYTNIWIDRAETQPNTARFCGRDQGGQSANIPPIYDILGRPAPPINLPGPVEATHWNEVTPSTAPPRPPPHQTHTNNKCSMHANRMRTQQTPTYSNTYTHTHTGRVQTHPPRQPPPPPPTHPQRPCARLSGSVGAPAPRPHPQTNTLTCTHTRTRARARTHARAHTHTHTHTRTHKETGHANATDWHTRKCSCPDCGLPSVHEVLL
jgi:hypothetical protein